MRSVEADLHDYPIIVGRSSKPFRETVTFNECWFMSIDTVSCDCELPYRNFPSAPASALRITRTRSPSSPCSKFVYSTPEFTTVRVCATCSAGIGVGPDLLPTRPTTASVFSTRRFDRLSQIDKYKQVTTEQPNCDTPIATALGGFHSSAADSGKPAGFKRRCCRFLRPRSHPTANRCASGDGV